MATATLPQRSSPRSNANHTTAKPKGLRLLEIAGGGISRVDADQGIIYHAKIVGLESRNIGRTIGLDSKEFNGALDRTYAYAANALESAIPLYDGASVKIGHPKSRLDKDGRRVVIESNSGSMPVGAIRNPVLESDGLYGDIHLIKSHRDTPAILETAQKMPDKIALSHNAYGVPVLQNGRAVINRILQVHSVDIVGDKPGTTNGLFETEMEIDERTVKKKTIQEIFDTSPANAKGRDTLAKLLESQITINGKPLSEMEMDMPADIGFDDQLTGALRQIWMSLFDAGFSDPKTTISKVKKFIDFHSSSTGSGDNTGGGDSGNTQEDDMRNDQNSGNSDNSDSGKSDSIKGTLETLAGKTATLIQGEAIKPDPKITHLQETLTKTNERLAAIEKERDDLKARDHARSLLETAGREVNEIRVAAVKAIAGKDAADTEAQRKLLIESWPKQEENAIGGIIRPRTSAPLMESFEPPKDETLEQKARRIKSM